MLKIKPSMKTIDLFNSLLDKDVDFKINYAQDNSGIPESLVFSRGDVGNFVSFNLFQSYIKVQLDSKVSCFNVDSFKSSNEKNAFWALFKKANDLVKTHEELNTDYFHNYLEDFLNSL